MPRGIYPRKPKAQRIKSVMLNRWIRLEMQHISKRKGVSLESLVQDALLFEIERYWKANRKSS